MKAMKKIFGIAIPLIILTIILGLLGLAYSAGREGLGCDLANEPGVQAGKKYFQQFIDQMDQYKLSNGKYPKSYKDLGNSIFDDGIGYPNPNITGVSGNIDSYQGSFSITFTFKPVYLCPLGQMRKCTYYSERKDWSCD